jgi:hypothetical protein
MGCYYIYTHTYVSDIYIRQKKKGDVYWSVIVVISSERIIVIALTGKHIFFDLSYIVYYVKVRIIIRHLSSSSPSKESLERLKYISYC